MILMASTSSFFSFLSVFRPLAVTRLGSCRSCSVSACPRNSACSSSCRKPASATLKPRMVGRCCSAFATTAAPNSARSRTTSPLACCRSLATPLRCGLGRVASTDNLYLIAPVQPYRMNERLTIQQGLFLFPNSPLINFETHLNRMLHYAGERRSETVQWLYKIVAQPEARVGLLRVLKAM